MARSCGWWVFSISASLGVYFGLTVFLIFTFYYHNVHAGIWGLFSGTLAALCLHLKLLSSNNRLHTVYTAGQLNVLALIGFIFFCISLGFTLWYIIYSAYHHIPVMPAGTSFYLSAVWSGMTAKWSFVLTILSYRYSRFIRYSTPFLIIQESA